MKVIHKQELGYRDGVKTAAMLPTDAKVMSTGFQGERLVIWYRTDTECSEKEIVSFYCIRTGEQIPADIHLFAFIGTANDADPVFPFVLHIFQKVL